MLSIFSRGILVGLVTLGAFAVAPVSANPIIGGPALKDAVPAQVETVARRDRRRARHGGYYRYYGYRYYDYRPYWGWGVTVWPWPYYYDYYGYYGPAPVYGSAVAYCLRRFRSYDPVSRTYLGYDGFRHPCP